MQDRAKEWYDSFLDTRERKIYTHAEHGIPGLRMIGCTQMSHATAPLCMHYHKDCFEFSFVVRGNLKFEVGGRSYLLSGGDCFVTFPNEPHDTGEDAMAPHTMYWLQVETKDPGQFLNLSYGAACALISQLNQLNRRVVKLDSRMESLLREAFSDIESGTELGRMAAAGLLTVFLYQVLKGAGSSAAADQALTSDIAQTVEYIRSHLRENISMEELARTAGLSVSRLQKKFKEQIGTAPRDYINFQKIELAKQLLQREAAVTEVAMELGFSSSDYFSVVFRRYTSISPTDFIQWFREQQLGSCPSDAE